MKKKYSFNVKDLIIWEKVFENIPEEWTQTEPSDSMKDCLEYFKYYNVQSVLDLGCGIGIWSLFLSKSGLLVKGVDFSHKAIDFARKWAKRESQEIELSCTSLINHSFKEEKFDAVLASKILDNISTKELEDTRKQIYSNLKPGGILFCLFNPYISESELREIEKGDNPTKGITLTIYTDSELENLFPDLKILDFKHYERGFRGLILKKEP